MPAIDFEARRAWFLAHLEALRGAGARLIVAERGGRPVGFVTVDVARQLLDQLAVDPAASRRGVASALMAQAQALSPGGLTLHVNRDNPAARRFYARHGFAAVAEGTNPRSGLPTLVLRWNHRDPENARSP